MTAFDLLNLGGVAGADRAGGREGLAPRLEPMRRLPRGVPYQDQHPKDAIAPSQRIGRRQEVSGRKERVFLGKDGYEGISTFGCEPTEYAARQSAGELDAVALHQIRTDTVAPSASVWLDEIPAIPTDFIHNVQ
ncbi:MAG: hypothetical protein QGI09_09525 [Dehalococcoidia bacterium]|nr:hypothetical protein [Dehalococcoidia bacterium]